MYQLFLTRPVQPGLFYIHICHSLILSIVFFILFLPILKTSILPNRCETMFTNPCVLHDTCHILCHMSVVICPQYFKKKSQNLPTGLEVPITVCLCGCLSPSNAIVFKASHWPSDHMVSSRPLIGQPSFPTIWWWLGGGEGGAYIFFHFYFFFLIFFYFVVVFFFIFSKKLLRADLE